MSRLCHADSCVFEKVDQRESLVATLSQEFSDTGFHIMPLKSAHGKWSKPPSPPWTYPQTSSC